VGQKTDNQWGWGKEMEGKNSMIPAAWRRLDVYRAVYSILNITTPNGKLNGNWHI